jgi:DNA-binding CsgD family transcriptional regulator
MGVVGRERELAEANGVLAEVGERACGLLLAGEAGIGKTTIWSAVLEEAARRDYHVLTARPSEAEVELPFAVLVDVFADVDDRVLDVLPPAQQTAIGQALRRQSGDVTVDPTAVALATLGALRALASDRPVIIAVDDLQWVDAASLRALTFAFRRLGDAHVGLVATLRTGFDSELERLASREGNSLSRIEIVGLGKRHLAQVVLDRTGRTLSPPQLARLVQLSRGNPLYAIELVSSGDPELRVPDTLAVTLRARLTMLSDAARSAGLAAATLGRVDEIALRPEYAVGLSELRDAAILDGRPGREWFVHPLLASTLVDLHTERERAEVHLALADALAGTDERAVHLARGTLEPSEAVARELEDAAERLDARGAPETAAVVAERAAALTPAADDAARIRRLIKTADLYQAAGEGPAHVLPLLEQLAETLPFGRDRARVLVRLGWLGAQLDSVTTSEAVAYQHRALEEAGDDREVAAAAHAVLARLAGIGADYRAWLHHAELAVAADEKSAGTGMFPSPTGELGMAKLLAGQGLDENLFERAIELETAGRMDEPYQSPRRQCAVALFHIGELARAREMLLDLLALSTELDRVRSTAGCVLHLVELEVRAGHLAQAEAYASEFVHLDRQLRGALSAEWYPSGIVAAHLGRVDDARRILTAGIAYSQHIESSKWLALHLGALGQLELSVGNLEAARAVLVPVPAMRRDAGLAEWVSQPVHADAIEVLVGLGELDAAFELAEELEMYGRTLDRPWGLATAARSHALIAAARGADGDALEACERALAEHDRLEWPFELGRTLLVTGMILRRLGRRRDATAMLDRSRSVFASLRNPLWLAKVDAEARRVSGRRAEGELTATEERVAELAGRGLRNAEIAAQLFVTPKTVEATLSRVYRKLGVRSRTELAHRLAERSTRT